MIPLTIAVVGATGAVGRQLIEVLEEREFPVRNLRLYASENSVGDFIDFCDEPVAVQALDKDSFIDVDVAFFCATQSVSEEFLPRAKQAGALCVDATAPWIAREAATLVVPEINGASLDRAKHRVLSNPASVTTMLALPLAQLASCVALKKVVITTFESVSGCGIKGVDDLRKQCGELLNGRPAKKGCFPHQMAFNCVPQVGTFGEGRETDHEQRVQMELLHLLGNDRLEVALTAMRVPVFYGDCASLYVEFDQSVDVNCLEQALTDASGIELLDDASQGEYPMPIDSAGMDDVQVGRLRPANDKSSAFQVFVAMDNLRKGAAVNMIQMVEQAWRN